MDGLENCKNHKYKNIKDLMNLKGDRLINACRENLSSSIVYTCKCDSSLKLHNYEYNALLKESSLQKKELSVFLKEKYGKEIEVIELMETDEKINFIR